MDDLTREFYRLRYKLAVLEKKGQAFEDFFSDIMEKRHPRDFIRTRPTGPLGDRKNDGYLRSRRTMFQCYAPESMSATKCIAKIDEDLAGAMEHWADELGVWVFVHNDVRGLGPQVVEHFLSLAREHKEKFRMEIWGGEELRREVFELDEACLVALFGPVPSRATMMNLGLEELAPVLDQVARLPPTGGADLRPVPPEKLEFNALSSSVNTLLTAGMQKAPLVRKYFRRIPLEQDRIAAAFSAEYTRLCGAKRSPDSIFTELQRFAGGDRVDEAAHQAAVLACLAFFFEECDIFARPPSESA